MFYLQCCFFEYKILPNKPITSFFVIQRDEFKNSFLLSNNLLLIKQSFTITLIFLFINTYLLGQSTSFTYGEITNTEEVVAVNPTADGGLIILGHGMTENHFFDWYLIKEDAEGNTEWEKWIGSAQNYEYGVEILVLEDGYALAGNVQNYIKNRYQPSLVKLDFQGNIIWQKFYLPEEGYDVANGLVATQDGGFLLLGAYWDNEDVYGSKAIVLKVDENGEIEHDFKPENASSRTFGEMGFSTNDGGYLMSMNAESTYFEIYKTNAQLDVEWHFNIDSIISNYSVQQTGIPLFLSAFDFHVAGFEQLDEDTYLAVGGDGSDNIFFLKLAADGTFISYEFVLLNAPNSNLSFKKLVYRRINNDFYFLPLDQFYNAQLIKIDTSLQDTYTNLDTPNFRERFKDFTINEEEQINVVGNLQDPTTLSKNIQVSRFEFGAGFTDEKTYGINADLNIEFCENVELLPNDNLLFLAEQRRGPRNDYVEMVEMTQQGAVVWTDEIVNENSFAVGQDLLVANDGSFWAEMVIPDSTDYNFRPKIVKYDQNKMRVWEIESDQIIKLFPNNSTHILPAENGSVICVGSADHPTTDPKQLYFLKIDANGIIVNEALIPFPVEFNLWAASVVEDNHFVVGGYDLENDRNSLIKLTTNGEIVWQKIIETEGNEGPQYISEMAYDANREEYIFHVFNLNPSFFYKETYSIYWTDTEGNVLRNTPEFPFDEQILDLAVNDESNILLAGGNLGGGEFFFYAYYHPRAQHHAIAIEMNKDGEIIGRFDYPNGHASAYFSVEYLNTNNFALAGIVKRDEDDSDILITIVEDITHTDSLLEENLFLSVFPNPTQGVAHIFLENNKQKPVTARVSTMSGQLVWQEHIYSDNFILNAGNWQQGMYILTIQNGEKVISKKIVVSK